MRKQNESRLTWAIAFIGLFLIFSLTCFNDGLSGTGDYVFLCNRLTQIRDCFRNGYYPFLYYEDVGGIGYGSPIFYGQLTLFPFIPLADNSSAFLRVYMLCCLLLNFFGFRHFLKRISENATINACFYLFSMPFVAIFACNLPAYALAVGFSWIFFGYCIDFFRDDVNCFRLILSYFLIWQSNFNATVLATLVCFGIFCVYFDRRRIRDYVELFIMTASVICFNVINIVFHLDAINPASPEYMLETLEVGSDYRVLSQTPIGGHLFRVFSSADHYTGFVSFPVFIVLCTAIWYGIRGQSKRFKVCSAIIGVVFIGGYIIGRADIWPTVYKATNLFFQYPIRYYIILFGFVIAVLSRFVGNGRLIYAVLVFCILDIAIVNPFRSEISSNIHYVGLQIANAEYASPSFVRDYDTYLEYCDSIHSESGEEYSFEREYGIIKVDCSANVSGSDVLTLPKLYYNGYQATSEDGESFHVSSGYSNYCEIDIGDYQGVVTLFYNLPQPVFVAFYVETMLVIYIVLQEILDFVRRKIAVWNGEPVE